MYPFAEPWDYLLLIFELWIINAHIRTCGVTERVFFSHYYTSTDGSEERDSRAYIVKEFVHVRGRVAYAWTVWNSNRAQERITFIRHDDVRELGMVVKGNERHMKVNFTKERGKDTLYGMLLVCMT